MATPRKPSGRKPSGQTPRARPPARRSKTEDAAKKTPARRSAAAVEKKPAAPRRPDPSPAPVLTTRQRQHLRGLGHHLDPVVLVGKEGVTDSLCSAIGEALFRHELIKLRLAESVDGDRHELATTLSTRCRAALVQVLGRTLLLYRRRPGGGRAGVPESRPHVSLH